MNHHVNFFFKRNKTRRNLKIPKKNDRQPQGRLPFNYLIVEWVMPTLILSY